MRNADMYQGKALKPKPNLGAAILYVVGATLILYVLAELVGRAI